ncbi:MAG: hypothetical protein ACJ701_07460 [Nitrososphaera sp.]
MFKDHNFSDITTDTNQFTLIGIYPKIQEVEKHLSHGSLTQD